MFIKVIIMLSLILTSCVTSKSPVTKAERETKHQGFSLGIHHITAIKEIVPLLQTLGERDLVAWDVDSVILTSKDMVHRPASDLIRPKIFKELTAKYGAEKILDARSKSLLNANWILVDSLVPGVIKDLQNEKVKTIALTAVRTNSIGHISDPMRWRIDSLRALGVDFKWPAQLEKQSFDNNTGYLEGVVGTGNLGKGTVLLRFLNSAQFMPKSLVFIDDKISNIEDVQRACKKAGIENFYGFQFDAETFANDKAPDPCMLKFQVESAVKGAVWPNDPEALDNMKKDSYECSANPAL